MSRVEIQFRTVAMDYWAQLDYQLCYKRDILGGKHKTIENKLAKIAADISKVDNEMLLIRKEIDEI